MDDAPARLAGLLTTDARAAQSMADSIISSLGYGELYGPAYVMVWQPTEYGWHCRWVGAEYMINIDEQSVTSYQGHEKTCSFAEAPDTFDRLIEAVGRMYPRP